MRATPVHNLRPNESEWSPPAVVFFDTETRTLPNTEPQVLALRCWAAKLVDRRPTKSGRQLEKTGSGLDVASLVEWVDAATVGRDTVWLFAHNLGFDLVTTRLPLALVRDGWKVTDAALSGRAPWLRLAKGRKRLAFADSGSWIPRPLAEVAPMVGVAKPDLPGDDDDPALWAARCAADVEILAAAMLQIMDWWDAKRLGHWTITGSACGWNAMRHTPTPQRIVVDPDPDKVAWERGAIYGGRRGVWRVGTFDAGPFADVDFEAAYPTVAAELPLPVKRSHPFASLPLDDFRLANDRWGVIADVVINTDTPRWPMRTPGGTFYPVGRFATRLAGPDIAEAVAAGAVERVGPGWAYRLGRAMTPWARWCLAVQRGDDDDAPPVARAVAKSWGRTVIGRWAMRSTTTVELGPSPHPDWHVEDGWSHEAGVKGAMVDLAGRRWWSARDDTGDNCFPAVLAFVESHVRVRLGRALDALGGPCVLQCDTDGVMVDTRHVRPPAGATARPRAVGASPFIRLSAALAAISPDVAPLTLRIKSSHDNVTVLGPQHVVADGERRFAGLPKSATPIGGGRYRVRQWPGLAWQMSHGDPRGYVRPLVEPMMDGPYPTGWLYSDGRVRPVRASVDADGLNQIDAPDVHAADNRAACLVTTQHPTLAKMLAHRASVVLTGVEIPYL